VGNWLILADSSKKLKRDYALCRQKGDVLLHIWKDKREVCMISTIYNGTIERPPTNLEK
jgi:hypothetical protein